MILNYKLVWFYQLVLSIITKTLAKLNEKRLVSYFNI